MSKKKLKLFMIDPQSSGTMGSYDYNLLRNIGIDEKVLFGNYDFEFKNECWDVQYKQRFNYNKKKKLLKVLSYISSNLKNTRDIIMKKPDIIHYQWFRLPQLDYFLIKLIRKINKSIKIVFTAHNILPHDTGERYYKIYSKIYAEVDAIIVHTKKTREDISEDFTINIDKIHVIPHGISKLKIEQDVYRKNIEILKSKHRIQSELVFGFLGNISNYKGIDLILEVWKESELLRKNDQIRLLVAGKPSNFNPNLLKDAVNKCGNISVDDRLLSNEEFQAYLTLSDVLILPYKKISQSGVLLSAIYEGKPVVASNIDGLNDPFQYRDMGWLFESENKPSLRSIIENIVLHPHLVTNKKEDINMWNDLRKVYSWKDIGDKTTELYNKLIGDYIKDEY